MKKYQVIPTTKHLNIPALKGNTYNVCFNISFIKEMLRRKMVSDIMGHPVCHIFMPPTSKKLIGHIGFGLSVRASIRSWRTVHVRVLKFHIWIPHGKLADTHFFLVRVISLSGVMPVWKNQRNLMHAISYEPCMLGFWSFIYGFLMEK